MRGAASLPTVLLRHLQLRRFASYNGARGHNWGAIRAPAHWTKLRFCHVARGGGGSWCSHGISRVEAGCVVEHNATMVVRLGAVFHPQTSSRRGRGSVLQKIPAAAEKGRDVLLRCRFRKLSGVQGPSKHAGAHTLHCLIPLLSLDNRTNAVYLLSI